MTLTPRTLTAEFLGTALLLAVVVGSGVMGETLAGGNVAIALLGNTIATGAILVVLILIFGPISGAHFNPAVTLSAVLQGEMRPGAAVAYALTQVVGAVAGVFLAHGMFDLEIVQVGVNVRTGPGQWLAEGVAAFGLVLTIIGCVRKAPGAVPYAVGLYITAGYWFTASTSFANPAVTIARALTETFSGIRPDDVAAFIVAQIVGASLATWLSLWLFSPERSLASETRPAAASLKNAQAAE
ncbi:MAG: MIP/aquaporin family protein [Pseudomonadota bacterium]